MKSIITLSLLLASTSQMVTAENISDTYSTGQILTSQTMNNIKNAVNSKQDSINSDCTVTEAIHAINSDGSVNCITVPSGGTGTSTDFYYIPGSGLTPVETTAQIESSEIRWNAYDIHGQYAFPIVSGDHEVGHGVRLPNGSTITDMRCYFYDNDPVFNIAKFDFNLYERSYLDRLQGDQLLQSGTDDDASTSGASTTILESIAKSPSGGILNHTIDNTNFAYYFRVRFVVTDPTYTSLGSNDPAQDGGDDSRADTSNLRTYGCRITYTH